MKFISLDVQPASKSLAYSFDVFDTVLVRTWAKPTDLFWELGNYLKQQQLINLLPDEWQSLRIHAEQIARDKSLSKEIQLREIYKQLGEMLNWSEETARQVMAYEIQLEQSSLRPIPENQYKIQALHQKKQSVAFLSDMYLPAHVVCSFLKDHQLWAEGDALYVSGEARINKGSGKLFQYHLTQHNLLPAQLHHTGDNLHSDIAIAKQLGINANPFLQAHLNRYEQLVANNELLPLRFRSLLAGSSRLTRLNSPETDSHKQTIWNVSANVIAPVFFGFVHWVLQKAQQQEIHRLYFMARDGQILWRIAQIICQKWGYNIDCRYLYASRQSLHFPAIWEMGETELNWLFDRPQFFSVRTVCDRVNLSPEQLAEVLTRTGFAAETWDKNLTEPEIAKLKQIFQDPQVVTQIVELAAIYRDKAIGYFKQEGIGDGTPFALVDTGWSGRSQRSFSKLLASADLYPTTGVCGFYFGLEERVKAFPTDQLISYFLDPETITERWFLCNSHILELFLAADHGSTVRYEQQGDRYVPVLRSDKNESGLKWGVLVQQQAILHFTKRLTEVLNPSDCEATALYQITEDLLQIFIHSPSKAEAEAFGTQFFSKDQVEAKFYDLAPAYGLADGFRMLINSRYVHSFVWLSASIQRSAPLTCLFLRYLQQLHLSYSYAALNGRAIAAGQYQQAWKFAQKAIQEFPPILLSRRFVRANASLATQSLLNSNPLIKLSRILF